MPKLPARFLGSAGDKEVRHRRPGGRQKHPGHTTNGSGYNRTPSPPCLLTLLILSWGKDLSGFITFPLAGAMT